MRKSVEGVYSLKEQDEWVVEANAVNTPFFLSPSTMLKGDVETVIVAQFFCPSVRNESSLIIQPQYFSHLHQIFTACKKWCLYHWKIVLHVYLVAKIVPMATIFLFKLQDISTYVYAFMKKDKQYLRYLKLQT